MLTSTDIDTRHVCVAFISVILEVEASMLPFLDINQRNWYLHTVQIFQGF